MKDEDMGFGEPPYPLQAALGYHITAWEDGFTRVELPITERIINRHGIPHGGVYAVLIDTAAGYSGCYAAPGAPKRYAMTLSLNTSFVGLPRGERLIAESRVTGGGRKTFFTSIELRDDLGTLVATGSAVSRYRSGTGNPAKAGA